MVEVTELLAQAESLVAASLSTPHQQRGPIVAQAKNLYARAWAAASDLEPNDVIRLKCALGYAAFLYRDVSRRDARDMARDAINAAELAGVGRDPSDPARQTVSALFGKLRQWAGDPCEAGRRYEIPEPYGDHHDHWSLGYGPDGVAG